MSSWKIPPRAKILHALSINAKNQINWITEGKAEICGVNVIYNSKENAIFSDEAESSNRGFLSAEALAVLIAKGVLPNNERIGNNINGIKWEKYNYNNYSEAEEIVKKHLSENNIQETEVDTFIQLVTDKIMKHGFKILEIEKTQSTLMGF